MADLAYATHGLDLKNPLSIKAAGLIAADTLGAGVIMGRGLFMVRIAWTAAEIDTSNELYKITFSGNTVAVAGTWKRLGGEFSFGKGSVLGGEDDAPASGEVVFAVHNPYDYQVRYELWVGGTIVTGFNFSIDAHPVNQAAY